MFKFKNVSQPTIDFLKHVAGQKQKGRTTAIRLICKTSVEAGKDHLLELLHSDQDEDFLQALMILNSYGKSADITAFIKVILRSLDRVRDQETLRHAGYVLESSGAITLQNFAPFLCHADSNMQAAAIYATRSCNDKSESWEIIEQMFIGGGREVMKNSILFWGVLPHAKLLPYYKAAWPEYKHNPNFWEQFIGCLKKLNLPDDYFDQE